MCSSVLRFSYQLHGVVVLHVAVLGAQAFVGEGDTIVVLGHGTGRREIVGHDLAHEQADLVAARAVPGHDAATRLRGHTVEEALLVWNGCWVLGWC